MKRIVILRMNSRTSVRLLLCILTLVLFILPSCKKNNANKVDPSYEKLGTVKVQYVTGFAHDGDPLCLGATNDVMRWRVASKEWLSLGRVGTRTGSSALQAICEDAQGNFYGKMLDSGFYMLPAGSTVWTKFEVQPSDTNNFTTRDVIQNIISPNTAGDMALVTKRSDSVGSHYRLFTKAAASDAWVLALDVTEEFSLTQITDNGDIFGSMELSFQGPVVVKAGSHTIQPVTTCTSSSLDIVYCSSRGAVNQRGAVLFFQGGSVGSREIYLINAGTAYPAVANYVFDLPDKKELFSFNAGLVFLPDGTLIGEGNKGGYDSYHLFIHKSGATSWSKVDCLSENVYSNMFMVANFKGEIYCKNAGPGAHALYRFRF